MNHFPEHAIEVVLSDCFQPSLERLFSEQGLLEQAINIDSSPKDLIERGVLFNLESAGWGDPAGMAFLFVIASRLKSKHIPVFFLIQTPLNFYTEKGKVLPEYENIGHVITEQRGKKDTFFFRQLIDSGFLRLLIIEKFNIISKWPTGEMFFYGDVEKKRVEKLTSNRKSRISEPPYDHILIQEEDFHDREITRVNNATKTYLTSVVTPLKMLQLKGTSAEKIAEMIEFYRTLIFKLAQNIVLHAYYKEDHREGRSLTNSKVGLISFGIVPTKVKKKRYCLWVLGHYTPQKLC